MAAWIRQAVGFCLLCAIYLISERAMTALHIPFPGSLAGLLLCTALIALGVIPLRWIEGAADTMLTHLALFYLPPIVAIYQFGPLMRRSGVALLPVILIPTGLVFVGAGLTAQRLGKDPQPAPAEALREGERAR